ncbi:hypothetical protein [Microvirga massiliensis]|uniref:hypothetical protein n=1 Tax=Microvirga massiliensis TaxID=1033741 RepID=UPI00062BD3A3|nr:hypothetical protein [Microvirga massiliensis]
MGEFLPLEALVAPLAAITTLALGASVMLLRDCLRLEGTCRRLQEKAIELEAQLRSIRSSDQELDGGASNVA